MANHCLNLVLTQTHGTADPHTQARELVQADRAKPRRCYPRRCRTAAASVCSASTVSSQPMQASVMLVP
jgi:hypothetical protein